MYHPMLRAPAPYVNRVQKASPGRPPEIYRGFRFCRGSDACRLASQQEVRAQDMWL